jgi:YHS domain-containing protein
MKRLTFSALTIALTVCSLITAVSADGGHDHSGHQHGATAKKAQLGPHGGELSYASTTWHEVVFKPDGVRVFLYDAKGQPVNVSRLNAQITMRVDGNPKPYTYPMSPDTTRDAAANALHLAVDLSKIPDHRMETEFSISGIPGQQPAQFAQKFHITRSAAEVAIAQQKICPVSGKPLGSMGAPPAVRIGDRDVYVCCAGCTNRLKADPAKYLAKLTPTGPVKATRADAAAVAFQKTCPVMNKPLNAMGGPWKINLRGRDVFVCCPGCTKALEREPAKYLAMLPTPPASKATQADAAAVANQKLCPVMNESLTSMGGAWKVYAKGQPVFVCCKGCIQKVERNPDFYLAKATRQASSTPANSRR